MLARKTWCGDPNAGIATRFPLRSRTARICPIPNSSKQPTCMPPKKTTGSPASMRSIDRAGGQQRIWQLARWLVPHVVHVGEAFSFEKLLRHELRRDTDAGPFVQSDARGLQGSVFGKRFRSIKQFG